MLRNIEKFEGYLPKLEALNLINGGAKIMKLNKKYYITGIVQKAPISKQVAHALMELLGDFKVEKL